ncbi:hypothetical protein FA95DRAFT_706482 [Auriscalpium vulgare]|uniref:Uncharacterized protein n=1 Tax=Auriscalpium vulgare TaxID=40419 RepID=A0ACB8S195_9AGAM|nr:hypothetical protein FA95DRAFT_706482 [Auriscalpium vulgare]
MVGLHRSHVISAGSEVSVPHRHLDLIRVTSARPPQVRVCHGSLVESISSISGKLPERLQRTLTCFKKSAGGCLASSEGSDGKADEGGRVGVARRRATCACITNKSSSSIIIQNSRRVVEALFVSPRLTPQPPPCPHPACVLDAPFLHFR